MASKKMGVLAEQPAAAKMEDPYEAEGHANTLMKAGEILSDPKKMAMAAGHIKKQKRAFKSVEDLKAFHQEKYGKSANAPKVSGSMQSKDPGGSPETDGSELAEE